MARAAASAARITYGMFVPRGTPTRRVSKMASDASRILKTAEIQDRLAAQGVEPAGTTPAEFKTFFSAEIEKWAKVVKAARVALD